jgi:hypothetical protein
VLPEERFDETGDRLEYSAREAFRRLTQETRFFRFHILKLNAVSYEKLESVIVNFILRRQVCVHNSICGIWYILANFICNVSVSTFVGSADIPVFRGISLTEGACDCSKRLDVL